MGWLRKTAKKIGKGIKKIGSKIAGGIRKVTRSKAFKIIAAIALATIVGPAAWATWGAGGAGTFAANLSAQTFAVTGGVFGTAAATTAAAPAAVVGSTASNAAIAAGTDALSVSLTTNPATIAQASNAAANLSAQQLAVTVPSALGIPATTTAATTAAAPNVFTTVGTGIKKFAADHPLITTTAASVGGGLILGLAQAALADDPRHRGAQVGESAQERSQLAALQAGYQAQYGRGAAQEMMLGMNFGYDSVGYQTTG